MLNNNTTQLYIISSAMLYSFFLALTLSLFLSLNALTTSIPSISAGHKMSLFRKRAGPRSMGEWSSYLISEREKLRVKYRIGNAHKRSAGNATFGQVQSLIGLIRLSAVVDS
jgi:hypothetical protein